MDGDSTDGDTKHNNKSKKGTSIQCIGAPYYI